MTAPRIRECPYCGTVCTTRSPWCSSICQFWDSTTVGGPEECWVWNGALVSSGYGGLTVNGKMTRAHRFIYEFVHGPIPADTMILHSCDYKRCVNPRHHHPGDHDLNMQEGKERNRFKAGTDVSISKLTPEQVTAIREEYKTGQMSQEALGNKYGVSQIAVGCIVRRKTWRHIA